MPHPFHPKAWPLTHESHVTNSWTSTIARCFCLLLFQLPMKILLDQWKIPWKSGNHKNKQLWWCPWWPLFCCVKLLRGTPVWRSQSLADGKWMQLSSRKTGSSTNRSIQSSCIHASRFWSAPCTIWSRESVNNRYTPGTYWTFQEWFIWFIWPF